MVSVQSNARMPAVAASPVKVKFINVAKVARPVAKVAVPMSARAQAFHASDAGVYNRLGQASTGTSTDAGPGTSRTISTPTPKAPTAAQNSTRAGGFVASGGPVTVDILNSDSGYENEIYWSSDNFATRHRLGTDNHTGSVVLGNFAAGTRIDFGIVNGENQFFRTGAAALNIDNFKHARSEATAQGLQIGFEDLAGGGDKDFNDAIIRVRGIASPAVAPVAGSDALASVDAVAANKGRRAVAKASAAHGDNRSGLGDGSNPGQGAGRVNSPNSGTQNPSQGGAMTDGASMAPPLAGRAAKPVSAAQTSAMAAAAAGASLRMVLRPAGAASTAAATATAAAGASKNQLLAALHAGAAPTGTTASTGTPRQTFGHPGFVHATRGPANDR